MSPGKVRESERRGERDLAQFEVDCGAVGEEGDVAGVEERAAGVVLDGRLEEGLAVGVVAGLLGAPRRLRPPVRLHRVPVPPSGRATGWR